MKITLGIVGLVAALILLVIAIGAMLPKHHIATRRARFLATPEQLFAIIAGPPTWRPEIARYEPLPDRAGRKVWRETNRRGESIDYEVVEATPPTLLKTRIATPGLPYGGGWTFVLHNDGDATTLRITEEGDVYNSIFRFVSRFIIGHTRSIDTYLNDLAQKQGEQIQIQD
jgi:hypothetical protein